MWLPLGDFAIILQQGLAGILDLDLKKLCLWNDRILLCILAAVVYGILHVHAITMSRRPIGPTWGCTKNVHKHLQQAHNDCREEDPARTSVIPLARKHTRATERHRTICNRV